MRNFALHNPNLEVSPRRRFLALSLPLAAIPLLSAELALRTPLLNSPTQP
jgi:hypothetical protein